LCNDPESYAGGSVATGRAILAGQVKGEHPDKERYIGPPGWGLGRWASTSSPDKKNTHAKKPRQRLGKTDGLSNKIAENNIEVDAKTKESTRKTEGKRDGRNKKGLERKKPK